ncbi:MAG: sigma-54-dependent transcriptional regulator, partial [Bacteroidota bacterium]
MDKLLLIEDDHEMCLLLTKFLEKYDFEVFSATNGKKGIEEFEKHRPDIVLCDYKLEDLNADVIIAKLQEIEPTTPVVVMSGNTDTKTAINLMKNGAVDFILKPAYPDETLRILKSVLKSNKNGLQNTNSRGDENINSSQKNALRKNTTQFIFGKSHHAKEMMRQIELVAPTNYSVIIYGESGAGKEAIAQTIHRKSSRSRMPFVAMDCGAISKDLAGSELFGHEKGSFTGAHATKIGHFELANGGTIFLDEIANLPYDVQSSLLRVVQERKVKRIGGNKEIPIDVRIIVASNENLNEAYKLGKFREDLYHRFNEFHLTVMPLRERKEDIMLYAHHFLDIANDELNKEIEGFSNEVTTLFENYSWHGNLREMKNVVRRSVLLSKGKTIEAYTLPEEIYFKLPEIITESNIIPLSPIREEERPERAITEDRSNLKSAALVAEYDLIMKILKEVRFNKSKAAKILNIDRKTLYNKMKAYDNAGKQKQNQSDVHKT